MWLSTIKKNTEEILNIQIITRSLKSKNIDIYEYYPFFIGEAHSSKFLIVILFIYKIHISVYILINIEL